MAVIIKIEFSHKVVLTKKYKPIMNIFFNI